MLLDKQLTICEDLDIGATGNNATALCTNTIDLTTAGRGTGEVVRLYCVVTETFAGATGLTLTVETDDDTSFAASNIIMHSIYRTVANNKLDEGVRIPLGSFDYKDLMQYVAVRYTNDGDPTAGKISIYAVMDEFSNTHEA